MSLSSRCKLPNLARRVVPAIAASTARSLSSDSFARILSQSDVDAYRRDGFVVVKDLLKACEKESVFQYVSEIEHWPLRKGKHMHFFEKVEGVAEAQELKWQLCRTEYYLDFHSDLNRLVGNGSMASQAAAELLGDPRGSSVFKERINYKGPGGGGFAPHQDAPAWSGDEPNKENAELRFMKKTLNMNIAIDPMFKENGGLEVVRGLHAAQKIFPQNPDGTLTEEFCNSQVWDEVILEPGDVLFFSLHIPHRSGRNLTAKPRRAVYITYGGATHMSLDERHKYYDKYRRDFPPAGEHEDGQDYIKGDVVYNWATPIAREQPVAM